MDTPPTPPAPPAPPAAGDGPFLWGVATSGYQSEGGYNGARQPQNNWAAAERSGDAARTGLAADFWTRWREDLAQCRALGLNAFRIGVEWSRIQPTTTDAPGPPPPFDHAALDAYAAILAECREQGLEPVVTLHHFTHPAWLDPDPWLPRTVNETITHFERFVRVTTEHLNRRMTEHHGVAPVRFYITVNEPNMLVLNTYLGRLFPSGPHAPLGFKPMVEATAGLLRAHIAAYNAVHDIHAAHPGWGTPAVTINTFCSDLYWADKVLLDLLAFRERGVPQDDVAPYLKRQSLKFRAERRAARLPLRRDLPYLAGFLTRRWLGRRLQRAFLGSEERHLLLDAIARSPRARLLDYIALDYYDPFVAHLFRLPRWSDLEGTTRSVRGWIMNTVTSKWWDWRVLPSGLEFFCRCYAEDLGGGRSVMIAENGCALRRRFDNKAMDPRGDRLSRSEFLRLHVAEVTRMRQAGVPIMGYLHWSLFDNYEWGSFSPRFGLLSIDYQQGTERHLEDPFGDRPAETYAALVRAARAAEGGSAADVR